LAVQLQDPHDLPGTGDVSGTAVEQAGEHRAPGGRIAARLLFDGGSVGLGSRAGILVDHCPDVGCRVQELGGTVGFESRREQPVPDEAPAESEGVQQRGERDAQFGLQPAGRAGGLQGRRLTLQR
jgi:hypothetical protein